MKVKRVLSTLLLLSSCMLCLRVHAQESDLGAWYMYFGNFRFQESQWGIHAEMQYRNHNTLGDLEQLLLRSALQYNLKDQSATFLAGYAFIRTENEGRINKPVNEHRTYQEVLTRQKVARAHLQHRFRYEQRWIEGQPFRTRYRYCLFVNVPLNKPDFEKGIYYLALYNEFFLNGQKLDRFEYFDRNRIYIGVGYRIHSNLGLQVGFMEQSLNKSSKGQLMVSLHQHLTR